MSHFYSPPHADIEPLSTDAARDAMGYSFFHWGISQWSVFTIVGLVIGYFQFRKKDNALISTTLQPIMKKRKNPKKVKKDDRYSRCYCHSNGNSYFYRIRNIAN